MRKRGDKIQLHEVETSLSLYAKNPERLMSPQPFRGTFDNSKMRGRRVLDTP